MRDALFHVERDEGATLQAQIREALVSAVLSGQIPPGEPIPSTRAMAKRLKVSRNTVVLAYQALVASGFLKARERSGYFVDEEVTRASAHTPAPAAARSDSTVRWEGRFKVTPSRQANIEKPEDWRAFPYPFIYGQGDPALFPIAEWRECAREALGRKWLDAWTEDRYTADDPMLIQQIRQRILPRRGISAAPDEILVTLGAQNALYTISRLIADPHSNVALEDPGYPDMRNTFALRTPHIRAIPVNDEGIVVDGRLKGVDVVYVTPSHQFPTTVTMSLSRRKELLEAATSQNFVIIEDDYEFETNYISDPCPALKSLDADGRVIYVGSLSKSLFPGLRLGFMVAPKPFIDEAKALRRLMLRHPPGNNQRTVALFLAYGHHEAMVARQHRVYRERWQEMGAALSEYLPGWSDNPTFGGTSFWMSGSASLDANGLLSEALEDGVVIEPGSVLFSGNDPPRNHFRLGFSSIPADRIKPGIAQLARTIDRFVGGSRRVAAGR